MGKGIELNSTNATSLVGVRAVWFPLGSNEHIDAIHFNGGVTKVTANIFGSRAIFIANAINGTNTIMDILFSTPLVDCVLSIYLEYSDGSIKDVLINL